jgi:hypothetical protein
MTQDASFIDFVVDDGTASWVRDEPLIVSSLLPFRSVRDFDAIIKVLDDLSRPEPVPSQ